MDKKQIKKFEEALKKYGAVDTLDIGDMEFFDCAYVVKWNGQKTNILGKGKTISSELPMLVTVTKEKEVSFKIFAFLDEDQRTQNREMLIELVNRVNPINKYVKLYVDDESDVTCEGTAKLDTYSEDDLTGIFDELVLGFVVVIAALKVKEDEDGEE